ncbi:Aspartic proteinase [Melia azedarach]|uniref:Aspartic proteinase n=1 Tax=Melia azedarach TaxID=155640 RepID=A0ACC1YT15_MELAZ|nr:Aspartic proteinase [Melia azedarach]
MLLVRRHFNALKEIASMISAMAMGLKPKGLHLWKLSPLHRLRNLSPASVQNIRFGFSYDSKGFGFIWWEKIAGILGLNRDPNSMIVQLGRLVLNRFSYCLVQPDKSFRIYLKFGDEIIAGKRLNLPPNTFSIKSNGQGGCMIDSGSVQTIIEYEVYLDLWTAFTEYFARYDIERLITCPNYGVLCFKMPAGFNSFPSMTYHFQGADLKIEPDNVSSLIIKIPIFSQQSHL